MQPHNMLFIMSDEHSAGAMGAAGHPFVQTPNLDGLAARGTLFANAYTPSPICVPARAAFATGRYVHETGNWDNGHPYDGSVPGWGHALQAAGGPVLSIGKLHYRDEADPTGFDTQIRPMHVVGGKGDIYGAIKDPMPIRFGGAKFSREIGPGESGYTRYDRAIADEAVRWLAEEAPAEDGPWVLFVSFVCPHFPLIAPEPFFALYDPADMPLPRDYRRRPRHPWIEAHAEAQPYDSFFNDEARRVATASYYGLCSFLDDNIGRVLAALEDAGLAGSTRVIYTSDHGENLGVRGLWGKSNMYEEAVACAADRRRAGCAGRPGLQHAGLAAGRPPDHPRMRGPRCRPGPARPLPLDARRRTGARRVQRIPCGRRRLRLLHAAAGPVEADPLHRLRPGTVRPGSRPRGTRGPGRKRAGDGRPAVGRHARGLRSRTRSTAAPAPARMRW